jgi:predicted ribosome quality control (RQC) complex YloA/Tae2 family protein
MIQKARSERAALEATQARLHEGGASQEEIARLAAEAVRARPNDETQQLPYRSYRTTSGLEVRAGRNSRANDQLTLHHSSPNDIWLHARDVSGAHVVLRWSNRDANPSARDIEEAACIAAVHSRARTSGLVPVDWTRRKYVRRARGGAPGSVIVQRARTVMVRPDATLERELRER